MANTDRKKKLIETGIPLKKINEESSREKSLRHGLPSTLHLYWARRPLATTRSILFAQLVDDPSAHIDRFPTEEAQNRERERLNCLVKRLARWEDIHDKDLYGEARKAILDSNNGSMPAVLDPFAGGGAIPLEAQRLGAEAHASDLNPLAVIINKALIEFPSRFCNKPAVHPSAVTARDKSGGLEPLKRSVICTPKSKTRMAKIIPSLRGYGHAQLPTPTRLTPCRYHWCALGGCLRRRTKKPGSSP